MFSCTSEECKLSLDLFFDLVGGASINVLTKEPQGEKVSPEHSPDRFTQFFNKKDFRFFHWNNESKKFALEVLYIKILTSINLLNKISSFRLKNQNTQIDLSDENMVVSISSSKGRLPLIWNFSVDLFPLEDINEKPERNLSKEFDNSSDETISYKKSDLSLKNKNTDSLSIFYRIGKILLKGLLVNDWTTTEEVDEQIKNTTVAIEEGGSDKLVNPDAVRNVVLREMEQSKEIFDSSNIIYQESVRGRSQGIIPEEIWDEVIVSAFNLLTAEIQSDFIENEDGNERSLDMNLDRFVNRLEEISRLIKIELFHESFQKKDICEVLNGFLTADQSVSD